MNNNHNGSIYYNYSNAHDHKNNGSNIKHAFDILSLENQLCFPLYAASREVVRAYGPFLQALDLTYTQYIVMMVLWKEKQVTAKYLGTRLFLDSGTLTPVLKMLEKKGFISRHRSRNDERILIVSITDPGMALRERALDIPGQIVPCLHLDAKEMSELYGLLYKILGQPAPEQSGHANPSV